jgi:hypothetical protein
MPDLTISTVDGSDTLDLTDDPNSPVFLLAGAKGLDVPTPAIVSDINPFLPGEIIRDIRDTSREVFLPVLLSGTSVSTLWQARARLFAILRPLDRTVGCRLAATDPGTGQSRYLTVVYAGGAEGDLGKDQYGRVWQKYGLVLRAPDPHWYATTGQSLSWSGGAQTTWFPIFPLNLSPAQILTETTVAGATNLAMRPSAEASPVFGLGTGWASFAGVNDPAMVVDSTRARFGTSSVRFDWPTGASGGGAGYVADNNLVIGQQYTASVYVWVPTGSPPVQLKAFFIANGTTSTLFDTWQRLTVTWTASAVNDFAILTSTSTPTAGQFAWVDGFQIETGAVATSYIDGDQPGCHWTGTAHGSTSVRDATFAGSPIQVDGDTQTWPVWTIIGPATSVTLVQESNGKRLELVGDINDGSTVTIDTRPRQQAVYDDSGQNLMGRLSPGFSFFPLDPGRNDISVAVAGADAGTAVSLTYVPRWATV